MEFFVKNSTCVSQSTKMVYGFVKCYLDMLNIISVSNFLFEESYMSTYHPSIAQIIKGEENN